MKYIEILVMKLAIYFIRKGWGADCVDRDIDEFPVLHNKTYEKGSARCGSCQARECIEFLENNIELCKW